MTTQKRAITITIAAFGAFLVLLAAVLLVKRANRPPGLGQQEIEAMVVGKSPEEVEQVLGNPPKVTSNTPDDKGESETWRYDSPSQFTIVQFRKVNGRWACESIRSHPKMNGTANFDWLADRR